MLFSNRKRLISLVCLVASSTLAMLLPSVICLAADTYHTQRARVEKPSSQKRSSVGTKEKREQAVAVAALLEAAELLKQSDELYDSIRLRAEIADVLWPHNPQAALLLLQQAWLSANEPGALEKMEGFGAFEDPREDSRYASIMARRHLIAIARKHGSVLAPVYWGLLEADLKSEENDKRKNNSQAASTVRQGPRELSNVGLQRLLLAEELANHQQYRAAVEAASFVVMEGATPRLLEFIRRLQSHDKAAAAELFYLLLRKLFLDVNTRANDILMVSAPFVSPELSVNVGPDGAVNYGNISYEGEADRERFQLSQHLRMTFFDTAAAVLLRQSSTPSSPLEEPTATYFVTLRLLPHFQREAPRHVPALSVFLNTLASSIAPERREMLSKGASLSTLSPKNSGDPLGPLLDSINRATNGRERDSWRFRAVSAAAARKLWDRAKRVAGEIEDSETQRNAHTVIAIHQVMTTYDAFVDDVGEEYERAAVLVRSADVPPEARAIGFTQAAELASRASNAARAAELLAEATSYAEQADVKQGTRAMALSFIILAGARTGDVSRSWELLPALVNSANDAEELPFDAFTFAFSFTHLGSTVSFTAPGKSISLGDVFAQMAKLDLKKALVEARGLKDELMLAQIMVAMSRAHLEFKGPRRTSR